MAHRTLVLAAVCLAGAVGVAAGGPSAPEGDGVAGFTEYCQLCHRVPADLGRQRTLAEWRDTVARMSEHRVKLRRGEIPVSSQLLIARHLAGGS
ncbi:MAG: hypothetical protein P1P84_10515 [Deferrisomatales bacterium]|nr:hypothetical protein [Deferrisomatales bacterium]